MLCLALAFSAGQFSCKRKKPIAEEKPITNPYDDSISTSYTVALPDAQGEGMRLTCTFFDMKRADTGAFRMTHVYMRHTGNDDTTVINGTWKLFSTDTTKFVMVYSGRGSKRFDYSGNWNLVSFNSDSMLADTGWIQFRQKKDNDMHNSTVVLEGKVFFNEGKNAFFIEPNGDTLPVVKISAFHDLIALNDSVDLSSPSVKSVAFYGTIQIRMAMDGKSTARSVIVEEIRGVTR